MQEAFATALVGKRARPIYHAHRVRIIGVGQVDCCEKGPVGAGQHGLCYLGRFVNGVFASRSIPLYEHTDDYISDACDIPWFIQAGQPG